VHFWGLFSNFHKWFEILYLVTKKIPWSWYYLRTWLSNKEQEKHWMYSMWLFFSFIACNSTITSNIQRQKHNNLATFQSDKLKGAHVPSKSLRLVKPKTHDKQMQTLTMRDMVVIENYYNMHYGWKHKLDETNTSDIVEFPLDLKDPFCISTFTSRF